jgi:sugar O-acyltransferase (sialic acid O-acetyltransferase NeuD family)
MAEPKPVYVPLLNPNEVEASLAGLAVQEGQLVQAGDLLATLETTKSAADVTAEVSGYVVGLNHTVGDVLRAGEVLMYLAEQPGPLPQPPVEPSGAAGETGGAGPDNLPEGLRITQPALSLAHQAGLDLTRLPAGPLVTESLVRSLIGTSTPAKPVPEHAFSATTILVYGGGGHGKSVIELLRRLGTYQIIGILDDGIPSGSLVLGLPVLGGAEQLPGLVDKGCRLAINAVGGIGNTAIRVQVFERLAQAGLACPAIIHPTAFVEASARLEPGTQVFPHAYLGSDCQAGFGAIINTGAIVSHDCSLGAYTNVSPGAMLAGGVQLGERVLVGMGATVNLEVKIGSGARIGNGATVKADVPAGGIVRAGGIWPGD